jgi:ParB family chromosome partitioning protein
MTTNLTSIADLMNQAESGDSNNGFDQYAIDTIQPDPNQPRKTFDEKSLNEMAETMKVHGVMQPIVIRKVDDGFMIVAGERRWRAAQIAGLTEIPAVEREISEDALLALQLIENLQRDDMPPLEEAEALERMRKEFKLSGSEVAKAIQKTPAYVSLRRKLLKLPDPVKALAESGATKDAETLSLLGDLWHLDPDRADYYINDPSAINRSTLRSEVKQAKEADQPTKVENSELPQEVSNPSGGLDSLPNENGDYDDLGGSKGAEDQLPMLDEETSGSEEMEEEAQEPSEPAKSGPLSSVISTDKLGFLVELTDLASKDEPVTGYLITDEDTPCGHIRIESLDGEQGLYDCNNYNVCIKGAYEK